MKILDISTTTEKWQSKLFNIVTCMSDWRWVWIGNWIYWTILYFSILLHSKSLIYIPGRLQCNCVYVTLDIQFTGAVNVFQMLPIVLTKIH
jgi:hypothetical protein